MDKKCKIVCLGDSITEGFGLQPEETYPFLLQQRLGGGYEIINEGATAHCVIEKTMEDGRVMCLPYVRTEKYADGLAQQGDIYILMLGTNDAQDGMLDDGSAKDPAWDMFSLQEEFPQHYRRILNDVRRAAPRAKIIIGRLVPILHCIWPKHQQKYLDVIQEHIDQIAAEHPEITVVDLKGAFLAEGEEWMQRIYQADGLHPGPEGAALIAKLTGDAVLAVSSDFSENSC